MKVIGIGNCQVSALTKALQLLYPHDDVQFFRNSPNAGAIQTDEALVAAADADYVLLQPILNKAHPLNLSRLLEVIPRQKAVIMPYVYCDGLFSLCHAPDMSGRPYGHIFGQEIIEQELAEAPLDEVLRRFLRCEIDFRVKERFAASQAEMARRERFATIKASPLIERLMSKFAVMKAHNLPGQVLMQKLLVRITDRMELKLPAKAEWTEQTRKALYLQPLETVVTPRDAEEHGFQYALRPGWEQRGERLIRMIAENLSGKQAEQSVAEARPISTEHSAQPENSDGSLGARLYRRLLSTWKSSPAESTGGVAAPKRRSGRRRRPSGLA